MRSLGLLLTLAILSGCSTYSIKYEPTRPPEYGGEAIDHVVQVTVSDGRDYGPNTYYTDNTGQASFDRPVAQVVTEALEAELSRFGLRTTGSSKPHILLACTVAQFDVVGTNPGFASFAAQLGISLKFTWKDAATGKIVDQNTRSAVESKPTANQLSTWNQAGVIKGFANEMVNTMLPDVIAQELKGSEYLRKLKFRQSDEDVGFMQKMALALLRDFEARMAAKLPDKARVAFVGFKGVSFDADPHSATATSSLMRSWKAPRYKFFTRKYLDAVLDELELTRSDLFDSSSVVELGRLQAVDYIITGQKSRSGKDTIVTLHVIRVKDAEVVASRSAALARKGK